VSLWVGLIAEDGMELSASFGGRQEVTMSQTLEWTMHPKMRTPATAVYIGAYLNKRLTCGPIWVRKLAKPLECKPGSSIFTDFEIKSP